MVEQQARVVSVQGNQMVLEADTQTACGACEAKSGCGTSVLAKWVGKKFTRFDAENTVNAQVGDEVIVGLAESALLNGSLMVYLWPLLGMILSGVAADWLLPIERLSADLIPRDLMISLLSIAGFAAAFGLSKHYLSTESSRLQLNPVVLRKVIHSRLGT